MSDFRLVRALSAKLTALCLAGLLAPEALLAQQEIQQSNPPQPRQSLPAPSTPPVALQPHSDSEPPPLPPAPPAFEKDPQASPSTSPIALPSAPTPQSQQPPEQPPGTSQEPRGTAAAPAETPVGVAASRPSGVAIAPAKQRRVRAIVISISLLLAAGAAVGIAAGLSRASHSTPR